MTTSLEDFLSYALPTQCACCKNKGLAADLVRYLDLLAAGETEVPLQYVFERHLLPKHKKPKSISSVRRHIFNCLKRDAVTGKPLKEEA